MENAPKISIIIPVYNTEKYLSKCLDSLINQTFQELELICVNDGSTDNSLEILEEYAKKDERMEIINQENQGLSAVRNKGLEIANGEFIAFVDSDDWVDLDYFEKLYNAAIKNNCDIVAATIVRKRPNSQKYRVHYTEEKIYTTLEDKINICNIPTCCYVWNKLYRAELVKNNFFKEGVYFEDVLWTPEVLKQSNKLVTVPNINYYYRVTKGSIVKTNSPKKQNDSYNAKKYIIKFFEENNIPLSQKGRTITKEIKYFCGIPILKIKEFENIESDYLFGAVEISFLKSFINNLKVICKQIFSISIIDGHNLIYFCGFQCRIKVKQQYVSNEISEYGLNKIPRNVKLIASLTTFPARINTVKETIKTLLKQTCKPDELVLWLAEEEFPNGEFSLPSDLLALKEYGLSIKWCNNIYSYKKLIPALQEYPNDVIITFDDDIYYPDNVIELLYNSYLKYPNCISTNRAARLKLNAGKIEVLKTANMYFRKSKDISSKNTVIGCGGVLYPPHCLMNDVQNESKFMSIVPTQDDIWFWAMAVLNNTPIRVVASYDISLLTVQGTQQCGLCKINNKKNKTGISGKKGFELIVNEYPKIIEILKRENK